MRGGDTWHGPITVLSGDRRDWRVEPGTLSVPFEQGPSGIVCAASGLILQWTRFLVGFIGALALYVQYSLFANEYIGISADAYSLDTALIPAGLAR